MRPFELFSPTTIDEAIQNLVAAGEDGKVIAGGTALMILLKQRLFSPEFLINVSGIQELKSIHYEEGAGIRIGSGVTHIEVENNAIIKQRFPILVQATHHVGNIRIRNAGTIGGNICQADSQCDPPAALVALDAKIRLRGLEERTAGVDDFILGKYETDLRPSEILTEILIPEDMSNLRFAYERVTIGSKENRPSVIVAVTLDIKEEKCAKFRLVIGAADNKPLRIKAAEDIILGKKITEELIAEIADLATDAVQPMSDLRGSDAYKKEMVRVYVKRGINNAINNN